MTNLDQLIPANIITKVKHIVNVFETSSIEGRYGSCVITHDGPGRSDQISYGRSQTTEHGNLLSLVKTYVINQGKYATDLQPYIDKIGIVPLAGDKTFITLLKEAGSDPIMQTAQDYIFDTNYFLPAKNFFQSNEFTKALSLLVIYDSYIQSGSIMKKLRDRFSMTVPSNGGKEEVWIGQYLAARHDFLANNPNEEVRDSVYRVNSMMAQMGNNNWDLIQPVNAHFLIVP